MSNREPGRSPPVLAAIKNAAPYLLAVLVLGWVLHKTNRHDLLTSLEHAPLGLFVFTSAVMLVLNCAADVFAMTSVFRWFGVRVVYRDLFVVRASTYLLAIVNYHVGQAAIIGYLYRVYKMPLFRATGCILFIIGINVGTLFLLASAGASNATGDLSMLRMVPVVCAVGVVVYALLLTIKPKVLASRTLFAPLFEMGIVGHIKGVLVRLPHVFVLMTWHYLSLHMFDIPVSPLTALLYLPAYFAVSSLPLGVNGIGVPQLVAVAFFAPYAHVPAGAGSMVQAQQAAVIAYSVSTAGISIVLQIVLGLIFLPRAIKLGLSTKDETPTDENSADENSNDDQLREDQK